MDPEIPQIHIAFGIETDIGRVRSALAKMQWYREHGYKPALPDGITENMPPDFITHAVLREYSVTSYRKYSDKLYDVWSYFLPRLRNLRKHVPFPIRDTYTVYLTRYGMGGSYDATTGTIVLNIKGKSPEAVLGILVHEIVHISVEPLIKAYRVMHWRKERLVDLICEKYFADIRKMQHITENVLVVDTAFKKFYPDLVRVARAIGSH